MKRMLFVLFLVMASLGLSACDGMTAEEGDAFFSGVEDIIIALGDDFDKLDGVSATDFDETDLTDMIVAEGIVNVNRAGEYEVTYTVTGENGIEVTITRTITVVDNARINGPELLDPNVLVGDPFDAMAGVTAVDHDGTDLTDQIVLSGDIVDGEGNIDTSVAGSYDLVYAVTGESGKEVTVTLTLVVFEMGDATVEFAGTDPETPDVYNMVMGIPVDIGLIASAKDFDGTDLELDGIDYDAALDAYLDGTLFDPTEEGTFTFTYRATGETGVQSETVLTVNVVRQGIEIGGVYIPVLSQNINNDGKPWNSTLIYTELKGKGEYGVLAIVNAQGQIILARDPYGTQFDLTTPIKQGTPDQIRGIANNVGWTGADNFVGLLGPQGTPGGIPEGGFAIFFSRDNVAGTTHPIRGLGLTHAREYALQVEVIGLDIPNFAPASDNAVIEGAEDITIYDNESFDPLEGVTGVDADESALAVTVAFNNVDMTKPAQNISDYKVDGFADGYYAVVYEVTGANGQTIRVTRRVTVLPQILDAELTGADDVQIAVNEAFDALLGVTATDYDGTDLTSSIILDGTVDNTTAGVYTLTYTVTGESGNPVEVTRTVTVVASARFVVAEDRIGTVYVGETFDPFASIEAFDADESDITASIVLDSSVYAEGVIDTSTAGTYDLVYTVTGSNGTEVELVLTLTVSPLPDATIDLSTGTSYGMFPGESLDLDAVATATDYDDSAIAIVGPSYDNAYDALITEGVFTPTAEGAFTFIYSATGESGNLVEETLTINVYASGFKINGTAISLGQEWVNYTVDGNLAKPKDTITIFNELYGMGEYGVVVVVDAHGRIVFVRDAFGEQVDINNPFKAGNPAFPTNLSGLPNFATYDEFTGGLWTDWVRGGADVFDGIVGPAGTPGGIPTGGFAIYFANGTFRATGLAHAREFAGQVELFNLTVPGFDPMASADDATIFGAQDIEIEAGTVFDPLAGITAEDHDGTPLTVSVVFNNVDTSKPVIDPQAPRVVNTVEGRDAYSQGWYSVVYSVTGENGYTVHVSRRVVVR
jgi:hypothetical protein